VQWAFVGKVEKDYELLHEPLTCKDYTHEIICNTIHGKSLYSNGVSRVLPLDLEKLQVVLVVPVAKVTASKDTVKNIVYGAKKVFSALETAGGLPKTLIKEVTPSKADNGQRFFILTMKKHMTESPVLFHSLIALIRTAVVLGKELKEDNVENAFLGRYEKDSEILTNLFQSGTLKLLLKEHKTIFAGDVDLKVIYPQKSESDASYHSGFGPVALQRKQLCSKWYGDNLYKLLKNNNIEF